MTPFIKRLSVLALACIVLALVFLGSKTPIRHSIAATQPATGSARPVIRAQVDGNAAEGTPGSYCWPSTQAAPSCDFIDDPQPSASINVAAGDTITFVVDPATPPPANLVGLLLDDLTPEGNPKQVDLPNKTFKVEGLNPGPHRMAVDALYTGDASEDQPFVRYVFLLQVGQAGATTPAVGGTPAATKAATGMQTQPPTAAAIATAEATTQAAVIVTALPTGQPPASTEVPGETATVLPPVPTNTPTREVVLPPPTTEILPTQTPLPLPTSTPLPPPTVEVAAPTQVPPTSVSAVTVSPVNVDPTATPQTAIVIVTSTPLTVVITATPAAGGATLPEQSVIVGGRRFEPIAVSVCVLGQGGEQICVNRPQNANAERIGAAVGDVAQINFTGPRPTTVTVSLLSSDGNTVLNKQTLLPDNLVLYGLPTKPGSYVFSVEVTWPQGKAIYYYRLVIGG